ncbi:recombinase family protein [Jeotgalicoccus nanhaiensis]|uniref:recombinase family protein n=1 Tax=Jeotgalicoccus nanhaiensis TaxID=568603 RepID=UPI00296E95BB|nr:recombinase family protein [Jeotgalicoccus nanhaiensis]
MLEKRIDLMKVAYARVSTLDQNLNRQIEVFKKFCSEKIFTEKLLGKNISERIVFQEAIQLVREGDQVIVEVVD